LAQGMIELEPPLKLRQRTANTCLNGGVVHQYRNRFGEIDFRDSVVKMLQRHWKIANISRENVLATCGVSAGIVSTITTIRNEIKNTQQRDIKIGLLVPFYTYHMRQVQEVTGKEPIYVSSNEDFSPNFQEIQKALESGLDILMFTNPGNPQGNVWTKEQIEKIVELTREYKCNLLIDEIYCDLVWKGTHYSPIQSDKLQDHVIVCRGFSKTLGCQSWRVGFLVSSAPTTEKIMRVHDPLYISVPWAQHSIGEYLSEDYEDFVSHIEKSSELMQSNLKILSDALQKVFGWEPVQPDGSMYGMFKHHEKTDKDAVLLGLRKGVGLAPGRIFFPGTPENSGYIRIHVGISNEKAKQIAETILSSNSNDRV